MLISVFILRGLAAKLPGNTYSEHGFLKNLSEEDQLPVRKGIFDGIPFSEAGPSGNAVRDQGFEGDSIRTEHREGDSCAEVRACDGNLLLPEEIVDLSVVIVIGNNRAASARLSFSEDGGVNGSEACVPVGGGKSPGSEKNAAEVAGHDAEGICESAV